MKFLKAAPLVLCVALLSATLSTSVKADELDKKTIVTFSGPVDIPGVHLQGMGTLPAGTYVFKLVDSKSDRHIVQIFNREETIVYATILAVPNYRLRPTSKTVITFNEGVAGQPEAIRAWFYPGDNFGQEFVYPKKKAMELAQVSKVPVLALQTDLVVEVEKPAEPGVVAQLNEMPVVAVRPTGEEIAVAEVVATTPQPAPAAAEVAPVPAPIAAELPATASALSTVVLFGLLSLGGGFAIWVVRKRAL
jgi:hypothetical protein